MKRMPLVRISQGLFFCGEQGHTSLFDCNGFKNANMTARCHFVMSNRLCWHCLERGHMARGYSNKSIKVCDKFSHCEIACPCNYRGKRFISGAVSVNRALHSTCGERKGVRLPIIHIKIYTPRGQKRVYALIDTGSEETLISQRLYNELN